MAVSTSSLTSMVGEVMTPVYMLTSEYTGYKNDHGNEQVVKNPKKAQTKECGLFSTMMFV
jgi:hypothetical protein